MYHVPLDKVMTNIRHEFEILIIPAAHALGKKVDTFTMKSSAKISSSVCFMVTRLIRLSGYTFEDMLIRGMSFI